MNWVQITMMVAMPVMVLTLLLSLWKAWEMFSFWHTAMAAPIAARHANEEAYAEGDVAIDWDLADEEFWHEPIAMVEAGVRMERVSFLDSFGLERVATVEKSMGLFEQRGKSFRVWYDPQNVQRITVKGPHHWLLFALFWSLPLAAIFYYGDIW